METKNDFDFDKQYQDTAEKVASQIMQQLPILKNNLTSLQNSKQIFILPTVIHNICVIFERQAYLFIEPAISLYKEVNIKQLQGEVKTLFIKYKEQLADFQQKESQLYLEQYEQMNEQNRLANEKNEKFNRQVEIESFNHLEADMSDFYRLVIFYTIRGEITLNEKQLLTLEKVHEHCIATLIPLIEQKQQALDNINKLLGL